MISISLVALLIDAIFFTFNHHWFDFFVVVVVGMVSAFFQEPIRRQPLWAAIVFTNLTKSSLDTRYTLLINKPPGSLSRSF